jgi:hypothetical protein
MMGFLSWSAKYDGPVESEYVIMEEACGTRLHDIYFEMELDAKLEIIEEIVMIENRLQSVSFGKYVLTRSWSWRLAAE